MYITCKVLFGPSVGRGTMAWFKVLFGPSVGRGTMAWFEELLMHEGARPKSYKAVEGCDPAILGLLNRHEFADDWSTTTARLGAGVALVVDDITKLAWADKRVMGNLRKKVPGLFDSEANMISRQGLVGPFRDGEASGTQWCMDVCAGVPETTDILAGAFQETVEAGFYRRNTRNADEPARLVLGKGNAFQNVTDSAARDEWEKLYGIAPSFPHEITAELLVLPHGDSFSVDDDDSIHKGGNTPCCISAEPEMGSVEVIVLLRLRLPEIDGRWRIRDTEHMEIGGKFVPLNRRFQLVVPLGNGNPPVKIGLCPDGLDPHADIVYLEGRALEAAVNGKVLSVLKALGWL